MRQLVALFRTARDVLVAEQSSGWTCPLFASSHLLIASVEQSMKEEEEVVHLSESWQENCDILVLRQPRF